MKTLEQWYGEFDEILREKIRKAAEEVMVEFVTEWIPHVETDHYMNVQSKTRECLRCFFEDRPLPDGLTLPPLESYNGIRARELIYERHRDEIVRLLDQDREKELKRLRDELEWRRRT